MTDADVIIVGAGVTGLMLACELSLAGVRPLVLEREPNHRETPKAYGLNGQILRLLRYRGMLDRFGVEVGPAPGFPFGGLDVDLTPVADSPLSVLRVPQPRLERLLAEYAVELGTEIRRGHEVSGVSQRDTEVTVTAPRPLTARYLVGCDGAHSRVRATAGIPFPGTTYPEVNRLGQFATSDVPDGVTRTDRGVFAVGRLGNGAVLMQTTEYETSETDDGPMTLAELCDSIRRVFGEDLPLDQPIRLSRYRFQARQAEKYRDGRIMLAGDAAHQFPSTGIGLNSGMTDAVNLAWKLAATVHGWAPAGLLDSYHDERHFAGERALLHTQAQVALRRGNDPAAQALRQLFTELLTDEQPVRRIAGLIAATDLRYPLPNPDQHPLTGTFAADLKHLSLRPLLFDPADRFRDITEGWSHRIDIQPGPTAMLVRPDGYIAWAATADQADPTLREALTYWFGRAGAR
ncbi:MAG TPA: FAD-dependent oxidoreductase [Pseudonocardiaceae bacterium]|nr:FAD-dependent oxidoreductase [Pseudonocardiaceae bacterium]